MPGDVSGTIDTGTIDTGTTRINASGNPQEVSVSAPKSLGEELRLNADEARVEAARDGEELTGADAIAVINQTWGDLNNKRDDAYVKVVPFPNAVAPTAEPAIAPAKVPDHPQTIKRPLPDLRGDELGLESLPPKKRPGSETRRAVVADQIRDEARAQAAKDAARTAAELGNADRPPPSVLRRIFRIGR